MTIKVYYRPKFDDIFTLEIDQINFALDLRSSDPIYLLEKMINGEVMSARGTLADDFPDGCVELGEL